MKVIFIYFLLLISLSSCYEIPAVSRNRSFVSYRYKNGDTVIHFKDGNVMKNGNLTRRENF
ncbi:MAG TPA: hypothetical protein DHW82_09775 [Spirochaetia bacterium]|nr:MAG: hypothetical protein A2Y41_10265 [Spirochaetes bacterium GWB1_36_13]HCL57280.1 hypothetical protein [Spirochaetia bacterium]